MNVSIVIPAYQAEKTISKCVRALALQALPRECYEIIVVDDASSDHTAAEAQSAGADVVRLAQNLGPAGARNIGLQRARGELVVFTDADCEAAPDFLANLLRRLDDPRVGGAKGVYLSRQPRLVSRFVQHEYEERYRHTAQWPALDFVDTYACCFRRTDLLRVGGFNSRLRVCEDQELSFRLSQAGVHVLFAPDARTYHSHCEDLTAYLRKKFRIARWKVRVLRQHPDKCLADSHTPQTLKLEIVLAYVLAWLVAAGRWRFAAMTLCAHLALTAPFVMRAVQRDRAMGTVAPGLLLSRDLALGAGIVIGVIDVCVS
jgi:glycosyltransferase involved in cell wall biosynthesis